MRKRWRKIIGVGCMVMIVFQIEKGVVFAAPSNYSSTNYQNLSPAIDQGGGTIKTSTSYIENSSVGQNAQGVMTSSSFKIQTGFQYYDYGSAAPSLTLSLSAITLTFSSPAVNTFSTVSNTITITTNAIHGYQLYAIENNDLKNTTYSGDTIPKFNTGATSTAVSWSSATTNGLGYTLSASGNTDPASDFSSGTLYRAFDNATSHLIASTTQPTQQTGGDVLTVTYQLSVPPTAAAGTYTNKITYSVLGTY